jgi:Uma2 family endonuclease
MATVTYEEWLGMPEVSDAIEEVINGEVRITRAPKWFHARILELMSRLLASQLDEPEYFVATAQFGLVIRKQPLTVRVPDLAVFQKRSIVEQDGFVHSAPQLIAEVLSPGERIAEKLADYAALGVPEVWVISPEARTVEVNGRLAHGVLTPQLFPSVAVEIARMWPD